MQCNNFEQIANAENVLGSKYTPNAYPRKTQKRNLKSVNTSYKAASLQQKINSKYT